jgi:hypothetical protein
MRGVAELLRSGKGVELTVARTCTSSEHNKFRRVVNKQGCMIGQKGNDS